MSETIEKSYSSSLFILIQKGMVPIGNSFFLLFYTDGQKTKLDRKGLRRRFLRQVKIALKIFQKDLNNNSPRLGYRLHSKSKAIQ